MLTKDGILQGVSNTECYEPQASITALLNYPIQVDPSKQTFILRVSEVVITTVNMLIFSLNCKRPQKMKNILEEKSKIPAVCFFLRSEAQAALVAMSKASFFSLFFRSVLAPL